MHVSGFPHLLPFDLYPLLQFVFTAVVIAVAILHLVKSTASKYFVVDASFEERGEDSGGAASAAVDREGGMGASVAADDASGGGCAVCGSSSSKRCMGCRRLRYCSTACQAEHWKAGHKRECRRKSDATVGDHGSSYDSKHSKVFPQLEKVLFPYEDFVKLFNWGNMKISPCGLLNCGNSCYANVVLQCLSTTRPLIAYLLEVRHARKCRRNDWCFLCELEAHVDRATHSCQPFSPINILSRLPNIGGNLGYGKQEDAHEFMRFAIDTMQSVCLDEFGGEKAIHPSSQETTLIQYIFGGQLQSQVKCSKCHKISYRHENMMDLTVEIQGDAESLEKCLDQFTAEEWLDGENMYKCDGCNDYVKACKRLAIHQAPNILTIALKRFQSGRFGKLNKRVTFPETLDLSPYMSEPGYGSDIYRLYAVVVHIDMLNASYFGHYICYVKDFCGNWYRIDDCKVETVELEEVLSQGAYMLLYSRISVRPSCVKPPQIHKEENQQVVDMVEEDQPCTTAVDTVAIESVSTVGIVPADVGLPVGVEKQQEKNVSEETQPCSPVFESVDVEACSSLSTTTIDARSPTEISTSNKFDVGLMNVDDSVKVDSRTLENATASTADVLFDSKSSSMDMDLDTPNKFDQMLSRGDEMDIDSGNPDPGSLRVKVDECGTSQSDGQSASNLGGVLGSVPPRETTLVEDRSLDCELVYCSNSEGQSSEETNTTRGEVSSTVSNLPQNGICELADSSCSPTVILHGNSSDNTTKPLAGFSSSISEKNTAKPARDKSCSNSKQKPMFSVGFLDKHPKRNTPNKKGTVLEKPGEVGMPCNVSSNCNGITKPDPQNRNGTDLAKPGDVVMPGNVSRNCNGITKPALSQGNNVDHGQNGSCSDGHNSIFAPGFLDKRNRRGSQNGNGNTIVKPSDVGVPCKPHSKCNGFTNNSQGIKVVGEDNVSSQNGKGKPSDVGVPCKPHSKCNGFTNNSQGIKVVHEDNFSSQNGNGNILVKPGEVGESCKLDRNCNGFTNSIASQSIHMVHDGNGISEHENGNILVRPGEAGASCRLNSDCNGSTKPTASGNVSVVHHGNGTFNSECQHSPRRPTFVGEVGSSWEASNFNGSANSGSLHKSREDHNNDRNSEYHKLEDQCEDIIIDDDGQEDDEGSRKFLNNLSAKKSLKKECRSLSDYHNCNKFPRVG